jgi:hypothetical protein
MRGVRTYDALPPLLPLGIDHWLHGDVAGLPHGGNGTCRPTHRAVYRKNKHTRAELGLPALEFGARTLDVHVFPFSQSRALPRSA